MERRGVGPPGELFQVAGQSHGEDGVPPERGKRGERGLGSQSWSLGTHSWILGEVKEPVKEAGGRAPPGRSEGWPVGACAEELPRLTCTRLVSVGGGGMIRPGRLSGWFHWSLQTRDASVHAAQHPLCATHSKTS